jgi:hypothetical protein
MSPKRFIMVATVIGSSIGSAIPLIWGDSYLSISSVLLTAVGGFAGIYIGYVMMYK